MESQECQVIEGGCGDFIMVGGREKPSLTCETRIRPDRQLYFEKGARPSLATPVDKLVGRDPGWKDVLGFRGSRDVEKPAGEWNRMEVICDGDLITNIVNGYVIDQVELDQGQDHFAVGRRRDLLSQDRGTAADQSVAHRAPILARIGTPDQDTAQVDVYRLVAAEAAVGLN